MRQATINFEQTIKLNLTTALAFIDLETTGLNISTDRIIELSILKIYPEGLKDLKTYRFNPTIPIPEIVSKVHGIYDEDVKDLPTFKDKAREIHHLLRGCDLAGYNSNKFDIPLLVEEFLRAEIEFEIDRCKLIDVQHIFHKMEQRTLSAAYKFYCNKDLTNAHSAEADILATFEILEAQIEKYKEHLQNDIDYLHKFCAANYADLCGRIIYNDKGQEVFNFGKHKGKLVEEIFRTEPSYYDWIMNGIFPLSTKRVVTRIRLRGFNS